MSSFGFYQPLFTSKDKLTIKDNAIANLTFKFLNDDIDLNEQYQQQQHKRLQKYNKNKNKQKQKNKK